MLQSACKDLSNENPETKNVIMKMVMRLVLVVVITGQSDDLTQ